MSLVIYGDLRSGACLKVKWTAERLGLAYDWVEVDSLGGQARTPEFRRLNPAAQVPTVLLADGRSLAQSNAIILHLAAGSDLIPEAPYWRAKLFEWLFWEQSGHEPYLGDRQRLARDRKPRLSEGGELALGRMESWLTAQPFLVERRFGLADIALLPNTRTASEIGFDLGRYPAVEAWIGRSAAELALAG